MKLFFYFFLSDRPTQPFEWRAMGNETFYWDGLISIMMIVISCRIFLKTVTRHQVTVYNSSIPSRSFLRLRIINSAVKHKRSTYTVQYRPEYRPAWTPFFIEHTCALFHKIWWKGTKFDLGKSYNRNIPIFLLRNPTLKLSTIFYEVVRYHKVAYRR